MCVCVIYVLFVLLRVYVRVCVYVMWGNYVDVCDVRVMTVTMCMCVYMCVYMYACVWCG